MAAATHGDDEFIRTGETYCGDHVRHARAPRNNGGPAVDHAVPNGAGGIVAGLFGLEDLPAEPCTKCFDGGNIENRSGNHDVTPFGQPAV